MIDIYLFVFFLVNLKQLNVIFEFIFFFHKKKVLTLIDLYRLENKIKFVFFFLYLFLLFVKLEANLEEEQKKNNKKIENKNIYFFFVYRILINKIYFISFVSFYSIITIQFKYNKKK